MKTILILLGVTAVLGGQVRKPRIAVGGILHESNTLSQKKTGLEIFPGG